MTRGVVTDMVFQKKNKKYGEDVSRTIIPVRLRLVKVFIGGASKNGIIKMIGQKQTFLTGCIKEWNLYTHASRNGVLRGCINEIYS